MNIEQSPITQMEQRIAGYWGELLGLQEIGRGDHFISLGGNSLLATMLANRIEEDMGIRPSMGELFNTLGEVATFCEQLVREQSEAGR
ncbi:phosphopantetheine-binding protein [Myxococcus stipitatus]|uniref:phosphopantetheine-binding protein n=1 Tax=Myxococcus stipitatus TaxID=83455 RepID=UPI001F3F3A51|nr:phosphopantetheine-binding protein [Myxococcus stipitatus]MCE9672595.1 phosphopantetheine-binding protein [Myxococcus stipitatus]